MAWNLKLCKDTQSFNVILATAMFILCKALAAFFLLNTAYGNQFVSIDRWV